MGEKSPSVGRNLRDGKREVMAVPRWSCAVGHRVEADTEEELVRKIQEHMRQEHGMEVSRERVLRELRDES